MYDSSFSRLRLFANTTLGLSASSHDIALLVGIILGAILTSIGLILIRSLPHKSWQQEQAGGNDEDVELINGEYKMVFLVRMDLEMGKGKVAAQCCHAVLAAYHDALSRNKKTKQWLLSWEEYGAAKITLKCPDEPTMLEIQSNAHKLGLVARSIKDAGKTQVAPNSRTVMAIGPGPVDLINKVTGHLKLY